MPMIKKMFLWGKKGVLALLLVSFAFFVVHDYVFEYIDSCPTQNVCERSCDIKQQDGVCQLHAEIHHSLFILQTADYSCESIKSDTILHSDSVHPFFVPDSIFHPPALS